MPIDLEKGCPCTKECSRHGDCVACFDNHNVAGKKPYFCKREGVSISQGLKHRVDVRLRTARRIS